LSVFTEDLIQHNLQFYFRGAKDRHYNGDTFKLLMINDR